MYCYQRIRIDLTNRLRACLHQELNVKPGLLSAQHPVGFVSNLYHPYIYTLRFHAFQGFFAELVNSFCLGFNIHSLPGTRRHLLSGIRPKVGQMKINQQLQSVLCRAFSDLHRFLHITVAAAKAIPIRIIRIVPDPDPDHVDAVLRHGQKEILLCSIKTVIPDSALLFRNH